MKITDYNSWGVLCDGSAKFGVVLSYLNKGVKQPNKLTGTQIGFYYGINKDGEIDFTVGKEYFTHIFTIDEFIKLVNKTEVNTGKMKALCLQDYGSPETNYATLMELGIKTIETRVWGTGYRGDLLIVCAKSAKSPKAGLALCVVNLFDIQEMKEEHEESSCCKVYPKAKSWFTDNLRPLSRKFPVKSKLSIFEVELPDDVAY